jgi:hypothetical protein
MFIKTKNAFVLGTGRRPDPLVIPSDDLKYDQGR